MNDQEFQFAELDRLERSGDFVAAESLCRHLVVQYPHELRIGVAAARCAHREAMAAASRNEFERAMEWFQRAEKWEPGQSAHANNRALVLKRFDRLEESESVLRGIVDRSPDDAEAWTNRGEVYKSQGKIESAIAAQRRAVQLRPDLTAAYSNFLLSLHYDPQTEPGELFAEHQRFGRQFERLRVNRQFHQSVDPSRPIRIGYLSPDFQQHAAARFIEPLLTGHDPQGFQIYLYGESRTPDVITQRFVAQADAGGPPPASRPNPSPHKFRRMVLISWWIWPVILRIIDWMSCRSSPCAVQVTYLGYPNTTGLTAIDYRLTDGILDPSDTARTSTEELIRLPGSFACFQPPLAAPEVCAAAQSDIGANHVWITPSIVQIERRGTQAMVVRPGGSPQFDNRIS